MLNSIEREISIAQMLENVDLYSLQALRCIYDMLINVKMPTIMLVNVKMPTIMLINVKRPTTMLINVKRTTIMQINVKMPTFYANKFSLSGSMMNIQ